MHHTTWESLLADADAHARALIEPIYHWVGYTEPNDIPFWNDGTGKFELG